MDEPVKPLRPGVILALVLVALGVVAIALLVSERPAPSTMWFCIDVPLDQDERPSPSRPGEPDPTLLTMWADVPAAVEATLRGPPSWADVAHFGVTPDHTLPFRERYWRYHVTGLVRTDASGRRWAEAELVRVTRKVDELFE